jgi:hypothetical protein
VAIDNVILREGIFLEHFIKFINNKPFEGKAIPVTGHGGP